MIPETTKQNDAPVFGSRARTIRLSIAGVIIALLVMGLGLALGRWSVPTVPTPDTHSVEAGFARDMQLHHTQAIEMAMTIRDRSDEPEIRQLAYDIALSQQQQSGQMFAWLILWHLPQASPDPSMAWMTAPILNPGENHEHQLSHSEQTHESTMPGMASREELNRLAQLEGKDAEKLFLTLMIAHHKGGAEMAQALIDRSTNPTVLTMANGILSSQSSEINYMVKLLAARS